MYKSLDTLPYKTFIKIIETENVSLLSKEDKEEFSKEEIQKFNIVWQKIYNEYLELKPNDEDKRILKIHCEINFLNSKYKLIRTICECLLFDWNDELVRILIDFGFTITDENYYCDLEAIEREVEVIKNQIDAFTVQLPKQDSNNKKEKIDLDDVFASFSAILGIDFDYNLVSVTKFLSLKKTVEAKIKALEKSSNK